MKRTQLILKLFLLLSFFVFSQAAYAQHEISVSFDPPPYALGDTENSFAEGNSGQKTLRGHVYVSARFGYGEGSVRVHTVNGSATGGVAYGPGRDYVNFSQTFVLSETDTHHEFNILINGDTLYEGDETFQLVVDQPTGFVRLVACSGQGGYALSCTNNFVIRNDDSTVPDAPSNVTASAGNASASVMFYNPDDGGSPITSYTVTSDPEGVMATGTTRPITVTGLTNGTAYTFKVFATNAQGNGASSVASNSVTPATVPDAPTGVAAVAGNAQANISFNAPADSGGGAITSYTVTSIPGDITGSGAGSPITVNGLTNGTAYTFKVFATNGQGDGASSTASNSVTPATVPSAPLNPTASVGNKQATVSFNVPVSDGGSAITSYTVTSNPGGLSASGANSQIIVAGLTNGTAYTFTVYATNSQGNGANSAASNSVTPFHSNLIFEDGFEGLGIICPEGNNTITYDFRSGVPAWFREYSDGQYWAVSSHNGLGLIVSKSIDDGTTPEGLFTSAGIVSSCELLGDFMVQVSYDWQSIVIPTFNGATGADLWIDFPASGEKARVLNYSSHDGTHRTNACDSSTCPRTFLAPFTGELKAKRTGEELTFYATNLDSELSVVAAFTGHSYAGPAIITIRGRQGLTTIDSRDAMSVSFESLRIQAASYKP